MRGKRPKEKDKERFLIILKNFAMPKMSLKQSCASHMMFTVSFLTPKTNRRANIDTLC